MHLQHDCSDVQKMNFINIIKIFIMLLQFIKQKLFLKSFSLSQIGIDIEKEAKPFGAKAKYVSRSLSNFKKASQKKQYDQFCLILNVNNLTQTLQHYKDN